jgi:hypothetical protein
MIVEAVDRVAPQHQRERVVELARAPAPLRKTRYTSAHTVRPRQGAGFPFPGRVGRKSICINDVHIPCRCGGWADRWSRRILDTGRRVCLRPPSPTRLTGLGADAVAYACSMRSSQELTSATASAIEIVSPPESAALSKLGAQCRWTVQVSSGRWRRAMPARCRGGAGRGRVPVGRPRGPRRGPRRCSVWALRLLDGSR